MLIRSDSFANPAFIHQSDAGLKEISKEDFGSLLTLEEAVERSMNQHAGIKRATQRFLKEKAKLGSIRAEFFPKLGLEGASAFNLRDQKPVTYVDLYLEQPLFQGGKTISETQKQKTRLEIEKERILESRLDVELEVRLLYIQILREKELIRHYQNEIQEIMKEKERFKNLIKKEIFSIGKLRKIKVLYEKARVALIEHKENYDYLVSLVKDMVGLEKKEALELEPLGHFPELEGDVSVYLDKARHHDPIYRMTSLEVKEKEFEKKSLQADQWPKVSLAVKGNAWHDEYINTDRVLVGVEGKWNIFDFGRVGGEIKAKQFEMEETRWAGTLEVKEREQNIKRLFHQARTLREKIRLKEVELSDKETLYKNEKIKIAAGLKGMASLIDSYLNLEEAKRERINVISEYRIQAAYLDRYTGVLTYSYQPGQVSGNK